MRRPKLYNARQRQLRLNTTLEWPGQHSNGVDFNDKANVYANANVACEKGLTAAAAEGRLSEGTNVPPL